MKLKLILVFTVIFLLQGCSALTNMISKDPEVSIKNEFNGNGIAVLNFTKIGPLPFDSGRLTADKLSDALFFIKKFNVIERSRVNDSQLNMEMTNTESLSIEQIQDIGKNLKANYLILGRIHCIVNDEIFEMDSQKQLNISFRIISVANQELIGVANYTCKFGDNIPELIQEMVNRIVTKISE